MRNVAASRNIKFVSHSDQGGRGDGVQIMVHRGYAYIGHGFSNGITVLDLRDPKHPKPVNFLPCPPNTRALHLQVHNDLLLAVNCPSMWTLQVSERAYFGGSPADSLKEQKAQYTSGLRVYDISRPEAPHEIAFMPTDGVGPHRIWYVGGRYAYVSIHFSDFSDHILAIVDMSDPTKPYVAGKWWLPGMWTGGGETPTWPKGKRFALHHALVAGDLAYAAWRDGGFTILDVADPANRSSSVTGSTIRPSAAARIRRCRCPIEIWQSLRTSRMPPIASSACATAGYSTCACRKIRSALRPCRFRRKPTTAPRAEILASTIFGKTGRAPSRARGYIFATYYNAGVRVFDIENAFQPREVAYYRAARSRAHVRSAAGPAASGPVGRLFRGQERTHVSHRLERRLEYFAV